MPQILKLIAGILIFAAWGALAFTGKTPMAEFITALRDALIALGVFQISMTDPKGPNPPGPKV